jgi:hypothetical protein
MHPISVLLGQQSFDTLDEKMEGIILVVGLRLAQKQKFIFFS